MLVAVLAVHIDWTWKRKLSPRGGRYFFHRVELAVPSFRQSDEKWSDDPLGKENGVVSKGRVAQIVFLRKKIVPKCKAIC